MPLNSMIDYLKNTLNPNGKSEGETYEMEQGDFISITLITRKEATVSGTYISHNDSFLVMGVYRNNKTENESQYREMLRDVSQLNNGHLPEITTYKWEHIESLTKYTEYAKEET